MVVINALLCSKDRPYQLHECIRTLVQAKRSPSDLLILHVLWQASDPAFEAAYAAILEFWVDALVSMGVSTHFVRESKRFGLDVCRLFDSCSPASCTLFVVDDSLWLRGADLSAAASVLQENHGVFGVILKLHPAICYCHPADESFDAPVFRKMPSQTGEGSGFYAWQLISAVGSDAGTRIASGDFNYAIDLCSGLYRTSDILRLVHGVLAPSPGTPVTLDVRSCSEAFESCVALSSITALSHPNRLEVALNQEFVRNASTSDVWLVCPGSPACVVITVNRVQDIFANPVYSQCDSDLGALGLLALVRSPPSIKSTCPVLCHLCEEWYTVRASDWSSVHIPDWVTEPCSCASRKALADDATTSLAPVAAPLVSVLIPMFNASLFLRRSLLSIILQDYPCIEVVLVDDGSTDDTAGTATCLLSENGFVASHSLGKDRSAGTQQALGVSYFVCNKTDRQRTAILIHMASNAGIAAALNHGLPFCSGAFVARADADDECYPGRIAAQVCFLERHPMVQLVGGTVAVVNENAILLADFPRSPFDVLPKVLVPPRHPISLFWRMLTHYCAISHPAVLARRGVFFNGRTDDGIERPTQFYIDSADTRWAEDYATWLALLVPESRGAGPASSPLCASSVGGPPAVTLYKRGHSSGCSRLHEQRRASNQAVVAAVKRFLHSTASFESVGAASTRTAVSAPMNVSPEAVAIMQLGSSALLGWGAMATWLRPDDGSLPHPPFHLVLAACDLLQLLEHRMLTVMQTSFFSFGPCEGLASHNNPCSSFGSLQSVTGYITRDVTARLGELATCAMSVYPTEATALLLLWLKRRKKRS